MCNRRDIASLSGKIGKRLNERIKKLADVGKSLAIVIEGRFGEDLNVLFHLLMGILSWYALYIYISE